MKPDIAHTHVNGICAECMRGNVDGDRNFCEKMVTGGECRLVPQSIEDS